MSLVVEVFNHGYYDSRLSCFPAFFSKNGTQSAMFEFHMALLIALWSRVNKKKFDKKLDFKRALIYNVPMPHKAYPSLN